VTRVLLVEDEQTMLMTLAITVRAAGYEVDCAATAAQALATAVAVPPDLVVLDLGLPDRDGTVVIEGLRSWTDVPIIVLSGRTDSADKVAALDAGADDYVTKPFVTEELLARLRAAGRRHPSGDDRPRVQVGRLVVDLAARTVTPVDDAGQDAAGQDDAGQDDGEQGAAGQGEEIRLTPTEWAVLELLLRHPGRLMTQRELVRTVWGPGHRGDSDSLRVYLARLRRKLEPDPSRPRHLVTEPGMGYRFQP
jgi:two-component system KDP operon response regulator KdpE